MITRFTFARKIRQACAALLVILSTTTTAEAQKKKVVLPPPNYEPIATKWEAALERAVSAARFREIAEEALLHVEPATAAEQFAAAERLAQAALAAANEAKHVELQNEAKMRQKDVAAARKAFDAAEAAQAVLRRKPYDAAAKGAYGKYLCFTKRDWTQGFALLAEGDDDALRPIVEKSIKAMADPTLRTAAGDAWWDESVRRDDGVERLECRLAAAFFYSQAAPMKNKLLDNRLQRRLDETRTAVEQGRVWPGLIEITLNPTTKLRLRLVPAGTGLVGSPATERWRKPIEEQRRIAVPRPFYLGITEVTQEQWGVLVPGRNRCAFVGEDALPVDSVSWNRADTAVARLNGLSSASRYLFRLPTSDEWEYACRAGSRHPYYFDDEPTRLAEVAWFKTNSQAKTHSVAQLKPNAWGFYDMPGNVREWTADLGTTVGGKLLDEDGNSAQELRIMRGGDYDSEPAYCRSAKLFLHDADAGEAHFGFRVACDVRPPTSPSTHRCRRRKRRKRRRSRDVATVASAYAMPAASPRLCRRRRSNDSCGLGT